MSEINNGPVVVTGEERRHPAIRSLARACIALARLRLEQSTTTTQADESDPAKAAEHREDAANG